MDSSKTAKLFIMGVVVAIVANDRAQAQFGFHPAPNVTNPSLPRVLLIGDSVMLGYSDRVRTLLNGKANVDDYGTPYFLAGGLAQNVQGIVDAHGPYDVIHFNDSGLHGFQPGRPPATALEYQNLMQGYVDVLKTASDRLIWATTTNVTTDGNTLLLDPVNNPTIVWFNENAEVVMDANGIPTVDLYGLTAGLLNLKTDQFHWNSTGYQLMAAAVAPAISSALAVPEPGTAALMIVLVSLSGLRRWRR